MKRSIDTKPLTTEQTEFLLKLRNFTTTYTNSVRATNKITNILEKNGYDASERDFILRTIGWYKTEKQLNKKD